MALAKKVLSGESLAQEKYLAFLKSGSSGYPLDLLKIAGIDMSTSAPIRTAIQTFRELTQDLKNLLK